MDTKGHCFPNRSEAELNEVKSIIIQAVYLNSFIP